MFGTCASVSKVSVCLSMKCMLHEKVMIHDRHRTGCRLCMSLRSESAGQRKHHVIPILLSLCMIA